MGEEKDDDAGVRKEEDGEEEDNALEGTKMWNACQQVSSIFLYSKITWIPSHLTHGGQGDGRGGRSQWQRVYQP